MSETITVTLVDSQVPLIRSNKITFENNNGLNNEQLQDLIDTVFVNTKYLNMSHVTNQLQRVFRQYFAKTEPSAEDFSRLYSNVAEICNINDHYCLYMARLWNHLQIYNPNPQYIKCELNDMSGDIPLVATRTNVDDTTHGRTVKDLIDMFEVL